MMNWSKSFVAAIAMSVVVLGCDNSGTSPKDAGSNGPKNPRVTGDDCVGLYDGITNCSINGAQMQVDEAAKKITVTGFPSDGSGGVSGSFLDAGAWFQDVSIDLGDDGVLSYSASSDGNILGRLDLTANGDHTYNAWATYSGESGGTSKYSVHVYDGTQYKGGLESIGAGADNGTNIGNVNALADPPVTTAGFGNVGSGGVYAKLVRVHAGEPWRLEGACEWSLESSNGERFHVKLPDGTALDGTKILFTEEVTPGHVVYNKFQQVDVQGRMNSYTITNEKSLKIP